MRWLKIPFVALALGVQMPAFAAATPVTLYRNPSCGCCNAYAEYLGANGFDVKLVDTTDLSSIKQKYAVPEALEGCHTAVIGGYVFEGLIPAKFVRQVLNEHRPIRGLSLPGMPSGAPGMPGGKAGPLQIYYLGGAPTAKVFATF